MKTSIRLLPSGETIEGNTGESLLSCLGGRAAVRADCGGRGICGKCLVQVEEEAGPSRVTEVEKALIPAGRIEAGFRLACQAEVAGPMQVRVFPDGSDIRHVRSKAIPAGMYPVDPRVRRTPASPGELPGVCNGMSPETTGPVTLIHRDAPGPTTVVPGHHPSSLGLAVDIGTTTVAAYLCDLKSGEVLGSSAAVNPQRRFGDDVVSRIQAASRPDGLATLRHLIRDAVGYLAGQCLQQAGKHPEDIDDVVVAGNTAMQHIFSDIDPGLLAKKPYEPLSRAAVVMDAAEAGLPCSPGTRVYVMPVISGFAGGDTVACALADRIREQEELTLIIDVGTNGELILGSRRGLWATSCATGPAFEGAQIACGMRAAPGAIHACTFDEDQQEFTVSIIDGESGVEPRGICGSGVIDAVLALRNAGRVLPSGQLVSAGGSGVDRVTLVPGQGPDAVGIYLTQRDIRQVQLAKAALATGIICLMEAAGISRVDRTLLTGAFGSAFDWRHATAIGMLPDASILGRVTARSNLAGEGAVMTLLDRKKRSEAEDIIRETRYLHLADDPSFNRRFVSQTLFP